MWMGMGVLLGIARRVGVRVRMSHCGRGFYFIS